MAASKKAETNRKTEKNREKKENTNHSKGRQEKESGFSLADEIVLWLVFALSLLILISNFGLGGFVGNAVSRFCIGLFGFPAYVLPVAMFLTVGFLLSNKGNKIAWMKTVGIFMFWICLCAFSELLNGFDSSEKILDYYKNSIEYHSGGGILGGILCKLFCPALGVAGMYVVLAIVAIISVVVITERSLIAGIRRGGQAVYRTARSDMGSRRQKAKIRRERNELRKQLELEEEQNCLNRERERLEESRQRRMDHKVSGVSFQTIVGPDMEKDTLPDAGKNTLPEFTIDRAEEPEAEDLPAPVKAEHEMPDVSQTVQQESSVRSGKPPRSTAKEQKEEMEHVAREIAKGEQIRNPEYVFPPLSLLTKAKKKRTGDSDQVLRSTAQKLQDTLHSFGVEVHITNVSCGPSVTRYELTPEQGVKVSRIVNLSDDIKLNLAAADIRIEAPIPGKAAVGIEVPNRENSAVHLRELLESREFQEHPSNLVFAAGKDLAGKVVVADIAKMPHLLIAGATGSGKSVCINTIIMSLIYKARPEDVKLIMIDPKVVELSVYNGIPHLFIPVVTDPKKAAGALNWAVAEMTDRYQKFAEYNVRDLKGYNQKIESVVQADGEDKLEKLPQIVIIVDELADLMMVAPGEVEDAICRLAQLARAAGIHLIIATQRPSVNVITGLIKANMPSRIAFAVSSGVDSRTIIDMNGAEKLLGKGDMLFYPQGYQKPARVQGTFVSDKEVADVVNFLTSQNKTARYSQKIEEQMTKIQQTTEEIGVGDLDEYFAQAGRFIIEKDKASIGMLQRMFKIGFNRAARIMDQLSDAGVVGPEEGTKPRKVLMSMEQFENYLEQ